MVDVIGFIFTKVTKLESKNLKRQQFHEYEIGMNKAEAMALRMSSLYGIDVQYKKSIFHKNLIKSDFYDENNHIFFDCTDNKNAREEIEKALPDCSSLIISCGNEEEFGQVYIGNLYKSSKFYNGMTSIIDRLISAIDNPNIKNRLRLNYIPTFLTYFKDFKDVEKPSCDQIQLVNEQSMPINSLIANLAFNVFYDIMSCVNIKYYMVKGSIHNTFDTKFLTNPKEALKFYLKAFMNNDDVELYKTLCKDINIYTTDTKEKVENLFNKYGKNALPFFDNLLTAYGYRYNSDIKTLIDNKVKEYENATI